MRNITVTVSRAPWKKEDAVIAFKKHVFISDTSVPYGLFLRNIAREIKGRLLKVAGKGKGIGVRFEDTAI